MSKIIEMTPHEDYTLTLSFDDGSRLESVCSRRGSGGGRLKAGLQSVRGFRQNGDY